MNILYKFYWFVRREIYGHNRRPPHLFTRRYFMKVSATHDQERIAREYLTFIPMPTRKDVA